MPKYTVVSWAVGIPLVTVTLELKNDQYAIGVGLGTGLAEMRRSGGEPAVFHVYRCEERDGRALPFDEGTFVAALLPDEVDGEWGFRLNYPAGNGRRPVARDLAVPGGLR